MSSTRQAPPPESPARLERVGRDVRARRPPALGFLLRLDTLPPLAVGETRTATVELARNPLIAGKYLLALPDAGNGVEESNESNLVPSGVIP